MLGASYHHKLTPHFLLIFIKEFSVASVARTVLATATARQ